MKRICMVVAVGLLAGCGGGGGGERSSAASYQQDIREPDGPIYRWDDTSLGVVCYGTYNSASLSCVKVSQ